MITIILTPLRTEYINYFIDVARHYDTVIIEAPEVDSVKKFLNGEIGIDELLYDIEYFDVEYTKLFYESLRELSSKGITVIPIDPYSLRAMKIRTLIITGKGLVGLDSNDKYIAYIESSIGEIMRNYNTSLLRRDFDELVNYTIKYAKIDAERIKFRSELRARGVVKILQGLRGDVLIHADYYNEIFAKYLSSKLGCKPGVVSLINVVSKKLGVDIPHPPGLRLTLNYTYNNYMDDTEKRELGAKSLLYVILRSRILGRISTLMDYERKIRVDASILRFIYKLNYERAKKVFHDLFTKDVFKVRLRLT